MNEQEELKKEFDEKFPEFSGVGAPYPTFRNQVNRNHIWQFFMSWSSTREQTLLKEVDGLKDKLSVAELERDSNFLIPAVRVMFKNNIIAYSK